MVEAGVDLVLLDAVMPRLSGLEACRVLKGMTADTFLPVVISTVKTDPSSRVEGLKIGADDYVCKPFEEGELLARIRAMIRIKRLHDAMQDARVTLERVSVHDELTGLHNYRYLNGRLEAEFKRAERAHEPLACCVLDIDHLKSHNDRGGRALGDAILRGVADVIRRSVREADVVARYGGDEFLVVLPATHFAGSLSVAERIWRDVAATDWGRAWRRRFHPSGSSASAGQVTQFRSGVALYPTRDVRAEADAPPEGGGSLRSFTRNARGANRVDLRVPAARIHLHADHGGPGQGSHEALPNAVSGRQRTERAQAGRLSARRQTSPLICRTRLLVSGPMRARRACACASIAAIAVAEMCALAPRALAGDNPFSLDDPPAADAGAAGANPAKGPINAQESAPVATIRARTYTLSASASRSQTETFPASGRRAPASRSPTHIASGGALAPLLAVAAVRLERDDPPPDCRHLLARLHRHRVRGRVTSRFLAVNSIEPWWTVDLNGTVPLYTFGKIEAAAQTAEANVRLNEWDLERWRQQARMDVRRAYFGAMSARDGRYILKDVLEKLDDAIHGIDDKLRAGKAGTEEVDRIRLEYYRDTVAAHGGEPDKGERFAMAALRFYTGVQSSFDIPDEPLKRPDVPFAPLVRYLAAARIFRPEVNMSRSGIQIRRAQVNSARANLFPDIGLGFVASYAIAPGADPQSTNIWANDPFNHFYWGGGLGLRWGLDFLPKVARIHEAESQLEEARATERLALGGTAVEVENAYGAAVEAENRERSWDAAEHKAKQWIVTVQNQIDLGTKQEKDLVEPLRAYIDARVNHVTALMDLNVSLSDLARTSGWDAAAPTGS